jgi:enterochelin esterase-like enzyme
MIDKINSQLLNLPKRRKIKILSFYFLSVLLLVQNTGSYGQYHIAANLPALSSESVAGYLQVFTSIKNLPSAETRNYELDKLWADLRQQGRIPVVSGDTALFLYRGEAQSVTWHGDFNGWGGKKDFPNQGKRLEGTDLWMLLSRFPADARLDYKVVINNKDWILDPANPNRQWGGSGPNSELRMPAWKPAPETRPLVDGPKGSLTEGLIINSKHLGYEVQYKVYLPAGYKAGKRYPVVYVTDGHEYADEQLGAMINVLDQTIASGKSQPVLSVFVDPRDPNQPALNRRMEEYTINPQFADFVALELVPAIDKQYATQRKASGRCILGTSLGGINSAYFGIEHSTVFGNIGIHSPAFWFKPQIITMYSNAPRLPLRFFITTGTIGDAKEEARQLKEILKKKKYPLLYKEVNEGHSWGNWRALIDDMLIYFYPGKNK